MILEINSLITFSENLERTNMLITAAEKIKAYNRIYQFKTYEKNLELGKVVEEVQNKEFIKIEISCSEHAIISLTTIFETFCNELVQELLYRFPRYFTSINTKYSEFIIKLINDSAKYNYESIIELLDLGNRFKLYKFFKLNNLTFLLDNELELIEYIYIWRNCFVHNGSKVDKHTFSKLQHINKPLNEAYLSIESKRLRTKMKLMSLPQTPSFQHIDLYLINNLSRYIRPSHYLP